MKKFIKDMFKEKEFLKTSLSFLGIQAFLYWFIKIFQGNPVYISYYLDDKIPFIGQFIYIYNLFYPFCFVALYFIFKADKKAYYKGLLSCILGIITCDIIYLCIPTIMYRPPLPDTDFITVFALKFTFFFDNPPINCFPSIHCLFCFQVIYSLIFSKVKPKTKIINIIISILIILSTMFVKQHYFFDMVSSLLICIITNLLTELFGLQEKAVVLINKIKNKRNKKQKKVNLQKD